MCWLLVESAAITSCFSIHPGAFPCSAVSTIKGFPPRLVSSPASLADRFAVTYSSMKLSISMAEAPSSRPIPIRAVGRRRYRVGVRGGRIDEHHAGDLVGILRGVAHHV